MVESKKFWGIKASMSLLRVFIGWHFLYEGIIKLYSPDWTSFGYLASSQGFMKPFFGALTSQALMGWVDMLNIAALIFVGLALLLGVFEKLGIWVAIGLLAMYYLAHPPFPWLPQANVEGSFWFVNKNLIELAACLVLLQVPTSSYFGIKRLFSRKSEKN